MIRIASGMQNESQKNNRQRKKPELVTNQNEKGMKSLKYKNLLDMYAKI